MVRKYWFSHQDKPESFRTMENAIVRGLSMPFVVNNDE